MKMDGGEVVFDAFGEGKTLAHQTAHPLPEGAKPAFGVVGLALFFAATAMGFGRKSGTVRLPKIAARGAMPIVFGDGGAQVARPLCAPVAERPGHELPGASAQRHPQPERLRFGAYKAPEFIQLQNISFFRWQQRVHEGRQALRSFLPTTSSACPQKFAPIFPRSLFGSTRLELFQDNLWIIKKILKLFVAKIHKIKAFIVLEPISIKNLNDLRFVGVCQIITMKAQKSPLKFKLGKRVPKFDSRTLLLAKYITPQLPSPPLAVDYYSAVAEWPMMANDNYGDCTCAAAGHMIQEWTANNKNEVVLSDEKILAAYQHFAKNDPDAGAAMLDVLKFWRKTGIGGDKISAFAQIEPRNQIQVKDSIELFGNCYVGVALPNFAVPPEVDPLTVPWVIPAQGTAGDFKPNPQNGHCIPAVGYDQRNLYVVTWGALKTMSWAFYNAYMDEAYAVLSQDWIDKQLGKAPSGFDFPTLEKDLKAVV